MCFNVFIGKKIELSDKKKNIDKNDLYSASLASVPFVKKKSL